MDMRKSTTFTAGPDDVFSSELSRNHLQYNIQIIGAQKEMSGVAALGVPCDIVLTSLMPARNVLHNDQLPHDICHPWVFPWLAFYTADILMRMLRDATLTASDSNMTLIRVQDCDTNWIAGRHVRLRVFFSGRVFESHPLMVMNARAAYECQPSLTGHWARALNDYAGVTVEGTAVLARNAIWVAEKKKKKAILSVISDQPALLPEVPVQVMLDGLYGGCSLDLGHYETVLLIAGESGATFTVCVLDDIVGRCARLGRPNNERTRRIEFVWCLRSYPGINWFTSLILSTANVVADCPDLDLQISVYVTCLCNPEAVPSIPNSDVLDLTTPLARKGECCFASAKLQWVALGGGIAVCASGPGSLTREASNAVAKSSLLRKIGGVGLHTEVFSVQ
ncbi:iron reductase [Lentinula raphanica]|nr:iron reductase [Lentinula raphanica]